MAENNKLKLAEEFSEVVDATLQAERKFYNEIPRSIQGVYTKPSSENKTGEQNNLFLTNRTVLNNREHPFQEYIDKHLTYNEALDSFREKTIFIPVGNKVDEKDTEVIEMEVLLDVLLAKAIIKWNTIQTKGIDYFTAVNEKYTKAISKKAKELLKAIESSPDVIKQEIEPSVIMTITSLANGYDGSTEPINSPILKKQELRFSYVNAFDDRYMPSKRHNAADRDFLIRQLVSTYMKMFGIYQLIHYSEDMQEGDMPIRCVQRCNREALKQDDFTGKYWAARNQSIIHSDIVVALLTLVDDKFGNEEQSTVLRRAQSQRETDSWEKCPQYHKNYLVD